MVWMIPVCLFCNCSRMYRSVIQATLLEEDGNESGRDSGSEGADDDKCDPATRAYLCSVDLAWGLAETVFFTRVRRLSARFTRLMKNLFCLQLICLLFSDVPEEQNEFFSCLKEQPPSGFYWHCAT